MNWTPKKLLPMNSCLKNKKLEVYSINKNFGNTAVLSNISLNLKEGEFVSILGPSGSGKSTLFNIIAGLIPPDTGKVIIDGVDYTGRTGRVSYMYQKDLLLPWKRIIDNVSIPLRIKGINKNEARKNVDKYFKMFGIDGFQYKYPFQLSGGMRQRAALMRTYMFSRDIILLDEPFGGLDAITRSKMHFWLMNILNSLNVSILFITHDIEEAILLSDRIYILSNRPAKNKEELNIKLPRPRDKEITTSVEFNNIKRHIMEILG